MECKKEELKNSQFETFFYETVNGERLAYYAFFPSVTPKSLIFCIHGGGGVAAVRNVCLCKRRILLGVARLPSASTTDY